jgi:superfamily II RNA helicase
MDIPFIAKLIETPPTDVFSQIKINFSMVLNLLLSHTPDQIRDLLENSFATYLMIKPRKKRMPAKPDTDRSSLWQDFLRHFHFLKEKGFVTKDGELASDGIWASRLRIDEPLLVAEGLRLGILPDSNPTLLAAIMAAFVCDREFDDRVGKKYVSKQLLRVFLQLKRKLGPFAKDMAAVGFEVKPLFLRPAATLFAWAAGQRWETVHSVFEIEEGDLAMLILRTADNLRHISTLSEVFPDVSQTATAAIDLILRDPVVMAYG